MRAKYLISVCILGLVGVNNLQPQEIVGQFPSPGGESRGLAWDGGYLWCADSNADSIYKLNPVDGTVLSSIFFFLPVNYGGITWSQDDNLWIAKEEYFFKVHPATGAEVDNFHCPGG